MLIRRSPSQDKALQSLCINPINTAQQELINLVKARVQEELKEAQQYAEVVSDRRLLRFLRGAMFDVDEAAHLFKNMIKWRREKGIDQIREDIVRNKLLPEDFPHAGRIHRYYYSNMNYGIDANGRPIHVELLGRIPIRKFLSCFDEDEWVKHHLYLMEYLMLRLDKLSVGRGEIVRIVSIYDLQGLARSHLNRNALSLFQKTMKITQLYYPEMMEKCFVINSPSVFTIAWRIVKPWIAERTVKKIDILNSNYKCRLVENIGAQHLCVAYGGNCQNNWPISEFDGETVLKDIFAQDYRSITIDARDPQIVEERIAPNSFVVWGFYTSHGEVKFALSKEIEGNDPDLHEEQLKDSAGGSFETKSGGFVRLRFECNKSTWTSSKKEVYYYLFQTPLESKKQLDSPLRRSFSSSRLR